MLSFFAGLILGILIPLLGILILGAMDDSDASR